MSFLSRWIPASLLHPSRDTDTAVTDDSILDEAARIIVRNGLETPAVMFLEMNRPISFLMSQGMHFLAPIVGIFASMEKASRLAALLDSSDGYDTLIARIEDVSRERRNAARSAEGEQRSS